MKKFALIIVVLAFFIIFPINTVGAKADSLSDEVEKQLATLDADDLTDLLNSITIEENISLLEVFNKLLKGEYSFDFNNFFSYILDIVFSSIKGKLTIILSLFILVVYSSIIYLNDDFLLGKEVNKTLSIILSIFIILLIGSEVYNIYSNGKNIIEKLTNLSEIMSPIIVTLIVACGGISASIYNPAVVFVTGSFTSLILSVIFPLVGVSCVFSILNNFSKEVNLKKIVETINSVIKNVLSFLVFILGLFISIEGISSFSFDSISVKITKYALSSSIPIVGSLVKEGFDIVYCGSLLIKNSLGIVFILAVFYYIISPIISNVIFSFLLRILSTFADTLNVGGISNICDNFATTIKMINILLLSVGFCFFIILLLSILSCGVV